MPAWPPAMPTSRERWPVTDGVMGRAIRSGVPQLVHDVRADLDYFPVRDDVVAELVVPLIFGSRTLGAVKLEAGGAGHPARYRRSLLDGPARGPLRGGGLATQ